MYRAIYSKMERRLFNAYHDGILIRSQALNCIAVLCKKLHPASRLFSIRMKCIYKIRLFEVIYWKQWVRERKREIRVCVCTNSLQVRRDNSKIARQARYRISLSVFSFPTLFFFPISIHDRLLLLTILRLWIIISEILNATFFVMLC